jgi:hypothetical protein
LAIFCLGYYLTNQGVHHLITIFLNENLASENVKGLADLNETKST